MDVPPKNLGTFYLQIVIYSTHHVLIYTGLYYSDRLVTTASASEHFNLGVQFRSGKIDKGTDVSTGQPLWAVPKGHGSDHWCVR